MAVGGAGERTLEQTPTWAVAAVCLVIVIISIIIEECIHLIGKWLTKRHKKAMYEALEKIKAELMLLGFISLLLTVGQKPISEICVSKHLAYTMLPCKKEGGYDDKKETPNDGGRDDDGQHRRRKLLWGAMPSSEEVPWRRVLAAAGGDHCSQKGMYPLVTQGGIHQLHIFIFVLAVFHVLYSVLTMALGRAKMKRWGVWERETATLEYQFTNDPSRFRLTHETSFVRRHMTFWSRTPVLLWIVCFFRQFFTSVTKVDYLTLRHGFIFAHLAPNSKFDFHKYIKRSLEDDFKVVVGISPPLWAFAIIFLLVNVHGWYAYFWLSFVPLIIVLFVGMKLQVIITEMALEIQDRHAVVKGTPVVEPSNKRFWFGRPQLILFLIHFTLFQNAFQIAFFLWIWYEFGLTSCFHERIALIITRVVMGVAVQFLCSYITFPLYALVTQMGSHMKKAIFEEQTANALKRWQQNAKRNRKRNKKSDVSSGFSSGGGLSSSGFRSGETTPSQGSSPIHLLHKYKTMADIESPEISRRFDHSENEVSDLEMDQYSSPPPRRPNPVLAPKNTEAKGRDPTTKDADTNSADFSFVKL
eukprot:Gb_05044 [translate_table: standard]